MSSGLRKGWSDYLDEPLTDDALIQLAMDKFGIVVLKKDLYDGIPANYVEENSICDFEEMMARIQKEIAKQNSERIKAGKESLKSVNEKLKEEHANDEIVYLDSDINEGLDKNSYSIRYLIDVPEIIRNFKLKLDNENTLLEKKIGKRPVPALKTQISHQGWMNDRNAEFQIVDDEGPSPVEQSSRQTGNGIRQRQPPSTSSVTTRTLKLSTLPHSLPTPFQKFHQEFSMPRPSLMISSVRSLAPSANLVPLRGSTRFSLVSGISGPGPNKRYPTIAPRFTSEMIPPEFESSRNIVETPRLAVAVAGGNKQGPRVYKAPKLARAGQIGSLPSTSGTGVHRISRINPEIIQVQSMEIGRHNFILNNDNRRQSPFKHPNANAQHQAIPVTAYRPSSEFTKKTLDNVFVSSRNAIVETPRLAVAGGNKQGPPRVYKAQKLAQAGQIAIGSLPSTSGTGIHNPEMIQVQSTEIGRHNFILINADRLQSQLLFKDPNAQHQAVSLTAI